MSESHHKLFNLELFDLEIIAHRSLEVTTDIKDFENNLLQSDCKNLKLVGKLHVAHLMVAETERLLAEAVELFKEEFPEVQDAPS